MVSVKYSNRTKQPCPRFPVVIEDLEALTNVAARTVDETRNSLVSYDSMIKIAEIIRWCRPSTERGMKEQANMKLKIMSIESSFLNYGILIWSALPRIQIHIPYYTSNQ